MQMRKFTFLLVVQILMISWVFAQVRSVTGKVTAEDGRPLEGVTVTIEGSTKATSTNTFGEYKISAKVGEVLLFTSVNSKQERAKVKSTGVINIVLGQFVNRLEEVVVTAGGLSSKKKEQGYNSTSVTADEIVAAKPTSVASALSGKVAGLTVSATGGGVNPDFRLILRGQRSLLGNNQALIVLDNTIVPSNVLGNLNPEDIADITVLNGAGAVALYGSDASNGALIVTTKKGFRLKAPMIKLSNTATFETVAFNPVEQKSFGSGGNGYGVDPNGNPLYSPIENQSYGPKFDGSIRNIGNPLADGSQQTTPYSWVDHNKFWNTGLTNQTDFSVNSGDENSTLFFSAQYVNVNGTVPHDTYNRTAFRLNGSRKVSKTFNASYGIYYVQNRYDITTQAATMYNNMLNMPGEIPVTTFKNWQTDKYSNPNGYYNPWYLNPYFEADNYRQKTRNDYLLGNLELKYAPTSWLDFTVRSNITTQNTSYKNTVGVFTYTAYAISESGGSKSNITGSVTDDNDYTTQLTADFLLGIHKKVKDFKIDFYGGSSIRQNMLKSTSASVSGLVVPGLYNLSNSLNATTATSTDATARKQGLYGDLKIGFRNYLFLHVTGRNDWVSVLSPSNWSFFYPAADISFSATEAIPALKKIKVLDFLKLRAGLSKVGNVNVSQSNFGAYALLPTFGQANGFPYSGVAGYSAGNTIVSNNITPEFTKGGEFGLDFSLLKDVIDAGFTWYSTHTTNQTVPVSISWTSGYSNYLFNTGETSNQGIETKLQITAYHDKNVSVKIGGNYSHNDNKVISINSSLPQLALATYSSGTGSYAVPGLAFPVIMGTDYQRDPQGRVIVNATTGLPLVNQTLQVLGSASPKDNMGLDFTIVYKHFRLYTLFEYRGGNKIYNAMGPDLDWSGMGIRTVAYNRQRFVFPNSSYADPSNPGSYIANKTAVIQNGNGNDGFWTDQTENMGVTSNYITSAAFWKLRQLSISYDVPQSVLNKIKLLKAATISVQGRNLFVWVPKSNVYTDPEYSDAGSSSNGIGLTNLQSPPSRYYGATISLTF